MSLPHVWTWVWSFSLKSPFVLKCSVFKLYKWITSSCCYSTVVLPVFGHVDISFVTPLLTPAEIRSERFILIFWKAYLSFPPCPPKAFIVKTAAFYLQVKLKQLEQNCFPAKKKKKHVTEEASQTHRNSAAGLQVLEAQVLQTWITGTQKLRRCSLTTKGGQRLQAAWGQCPSNVESMRQTHVMCPSALICCFPSRLEG